MNRRRRLILKRTGKSRPRAAAAASNSTSDESPSPEESQPETQPEAAANEEEQEGSEAESSEETSAPEVHGENHIRFPLVSSHLQGDRVNTTGLLVSPHGCGLVHCSAMPRRLNVGVERAAPFIAAAHRGMLRRLGKRETQRKVAEAFCTRARQGDQNAMAMMAMVRDSAKRGSPDALVSLKFMQDFVNKNPVTASSFGFEAGVPCMKPDTLGAMSLANGPALTNPRIRGVAASFGEDQTTLLEGMRKWQSDHDASHVKLSMRLDSMQRDILKMGRTLGKARALQMLRLGAPIAIYDRNTAWELGE